MIHFGKLPMLMDRKDASGNPLPFSLKYVKKSTGEEIYIDQAVLTSSNHLEYFNVKILASGEIRKLILPLITEFNGTKTFI
ncbi:MAG: hypothetical protein IH597_14920 [Bacteroidales bacterium]|nr:hypothetical protein [Bacteroidales bacterium]